MVPALLCAGCEKLDDKIEDFPDAGESREPASVSLDELAELFAEVPFGTQQMEEVYQAVLASADNGYDEEYTLRNLFAAPGTGVGEDKLETKSPVRSYSVPMRDLLEQTVRQRAARTKASGEEPMDADAYLRALQDSDAQIYWPYFENWEGDVLPVITFDPGDNTSNNIGYRLVGEGTDRHVEKVDVNEALAMETPVWVINRNDDAAYTTLQVLRKNDPDWGQGGSVTVRSVGDAGGSTRTLFIKEFKMINNYDCWFAGASEFFIKAGKVEDFRASTEAELKLYAPAITDFMLVCRRRWRGQIINVNTVLVSEWTDQLDKIAFSRRGRRRQYDQLEMLRHGKVQFQELRHRAGSSLPPLRRHRLARSAQQLLPHQIQRPALPLRRCRNLLRLRVIAEPSFHGLSSAYGNRTVIPRLVRGICSPVLRKPVVATAVRARKCGNGAAPGA